VQSPEKRRAYYIANKDIILNKRRLYCQKNKSRLQLIATAKRKKNITKCLLSEMFYRARERARHKCIEFNITKEYLQAIVPDENKCTYLGLEFKSDGVKNSCSLDRVDNNLGYVIGNIELISTYANTLKNSSSILEQQKLVKWLEKFHVELNDVDVVKCVYFDELDNVAKYFLNKKKHGNIHISFEYFLSLLPLDKCCPVFGTKLKFDGNPMAPSYITLDRLDLPKGMRLAMCVCAVQESKYV